MKVDKFFDVTLCEEIIEAYFNILWMKGDSPNLLQNMSCASSKKCSSLL